jgi:hypothetical protein
MASRIEMTKGEFLKEHKTLVRELKHPKAGVLKREAKKQSEEVRRKTGKRIG